MITALAFVVVALGWVGWAVWRLGDATDRLGAHVEAHGARLAILSRDADATLAGAPDEAALRRATRTPRGTLPSGGSE